MSFFRNRGLRLGVAGVAAFFLLYALVRLFGQHKPLKPFFQQNSTILFALYTFLISLSLVFLFILVRYLIRLFWGKTEYTGNSRFKHRLVLFFVLFSIVPTLLLFFFASEMLDRGINAIFNPELSGLMEKVSELNKQYYQDSKEELRNYSILVRDRLKNRQISLLENTSLLRSELRRLMKEYHLDAINLYRNHKEILSFIKPVIPLKEYRDLKIEEVYRFLSGSSFIRVDTLSNGELLRCGQHFTLPGDDRMLIITGRFQNNRTIRNMKDLVAMAERFQHLQSIKNPVRTTYLLFLIFITILIIFAASWLGIYLARGITIPVDRLIQGASQISKGNLDVQVEYSGHDEFEDLINEFNRMVREMRDNQTKLQRKTHELRNRRSIIETILKNISSGIIALNTRREIVELNPECERLFGLSRRQVLKRPYAQIFSSTPISAIKEILDEAYTTPGKWLEKELDLKIGGRIVYLSVRITQIQSAGGMVSGLLAVITDLTALIKAQRTTLWREVAQRIAHEIKNPLTPIQFSAERVIRNLGLPEQQFRKLSEESLSIILSELDAIKKLAEEFANFARLPEMRFTTGDINVLLEKLLVIYRPIYTHVTFEVELDAALPMIRRMDPDQLRRIFVNIIDNALAAMDHRGVLKIQTSHLPDIQFVRIDIADDGPGIPDEDKKRLFIPYFSRKETGTGLGLAIAHSIIEEHNGQITVMDNQPRGARFVIEFPA